jgi:hypothetical protein
MMKKTKSACKIAGIVAAAFLAVNWWNYFTYNKDHYDMVSRPRGLFGYERIVTESDGSHEVRYYPGLGRNMFKYQVSYDNNGDGLVDKIELKGNGFRNEGLPGILQTCDDEYQHQDMYENANSRLQRLMSNYPSRFNHALNPQMMAHCSK